MHYRAICQQNGNAVHYRIALAAALTAYHGRLQLQRLVTDWTNNAPQMLRRQELCMHGHMLADNPGE
jgi:hypothetical protein